MCDRGLIVDRGLLDALEGRNVRRFSPGWRKGASWEMIAHIFSTDLLKVYSRGFFTLSVWSNMRISTFRWSSIDAV